MANPTSSCTNICAWFQKKENFSEKSKNAMKITAFVISLILLTIAVIASLVSTGVMTEIFPLYSLGKIGQLTSGILLTLSFISTIITGALLVKVFREKSCCTKPKNAVSQESMAMKQEETPTPPPATNANETPAKAEQKPTATQPDNSVSKKGWFSWW